MGDQALAVAELDRHPQRTAQGVGGTHVMYVLRHGDKAEQYSGLPANPEISPLVSLWKSAFKPLALLGMGAAALAGFFHYMKVGPIESKEDEKESA